MSHGEQGREDADGEEHLGAEVKETLGDEGAKAGLQAKGEFTSIAFEISGLRTIRLRWLKASRNGPLDAEG